MFLLRTLRRRITFLPANIPLESTRLSVTKSLQRRRRRCGSIRCEIRHVSSTSCCTHVVRLRCAVHGSSRDSCEQDLSYCRNLKHRYLGRIASINRQELDSGRTAPNTVSHKSDQMSACGWTVSRAPSLLTCLLLFRSP